MGALACRFAVAAFIVVAAAAAPLKFEDQITVGPFPSEPIDLATLSAELQRQRIVVDVAPELAGRRISLPAGSLSLRQIFEAVREQTGANVLFGRCGNAPSTILFGGGPPMAIVVHG